MKRWCFFMAVFCVTLFVDTGYATRTSSNLPEGPSFEDVL